MAIKFKSAYDTRSEKAESTPSGTKIAFEHRETIGEDGRRSLVKDRAVNIYEKIQESADSCDIQNIIRRAAEGDVNALNMVNGQYIDITGAPATLAQAQQFVIRAKSEFDELPKEIRYAFENNAEMYVAQYGTKEWADKTGLTAKIEQQKKAEEQMKIDEEYMRTAMKNIAEKGSIINE